VEFYGALREEQSPLQKSVEKSIGVLSQHGFGKTVIRRSDRGRKVNTLVLTTGASCLLNGDKTTEFLISIIVAPPEKKRAQRRQSLIGQSA
jgi:hypothetical protein